MFRSWLNLASAILLLLLPSIASQAQEIMNLNRLLHERDSSGYQISRISFDLISEDKNVAYVTKLKFIDRSAKREFFLKKITGDFNKLIYAGTNKKLDWDHKDELVYYQRSNPELELDVSPALQIEKKIRRGRALPLFADPLVVSDTMYTVSLYRKNAHFGTLEENFKIKTLNAIELPKNTPTRKFQLAFTNGNHTIYTNSFKVKPKVSNFWKVIPFVVGAGVIGYLWYDKQTEPLPQPPIPTLN
jgi:hypothetical protein